MSGKTITHNTGNAAVPVADGVPGSRPLSNSRREKYCQLRALMMPRVAAYKSSGWNVATNVVAGVNAARLEASPDVADRIAYLGRQGEDLIKAKRQRLEESLWHQHEADIGNLFETVEVPKLNRKGEPVMDKEGQPVTYKRQVVRDLQQVPPELRHAIESISLDAKGNVAAKLVSKLEANKELRKMLGLDNQRAVDSEISRMSDAELVSELAKQANELGVQIDLSYKFGED
jgi:hypothetical protein